MLRPSNFGELPVAASLSVLGVTRSVEPYQFASIVLDSYVYCIGFLRVQQSPMSRTSRHELRHPDALRYATTLQRDPRRMQCEVPKVA